MQRYAVLAARLERAEQKIAIMSKILGILIKRDTIVADVSVKLGQKDYTAAMERLRELEGSALEVASVVAEWSDDKA